MKETAVLVWNCEKCGHINKPYGDSATVVPAYLAQVKCENCGHIRYNAEWSDSETKMMMDRKGKGLPLVLGKASRGDSEKVASLEAKVNVLEESRNADRKEIELVRKMLDDLIQNELKRVKESASDRDQDLATLSARVKALEEDRDFQKANK